MAWILGVLLTGVFFGAYHVAMKLASPHIHQIVGAVILQVVAALLGGLVLLYLKSSHHDLSFSSIGVRYAILAGLFVGLAEIMAFYVFSKGAPASVAIPMIVGTMVVTGTMLGVFLLKESLTLVQYAGIGLTLLGVVLITLKTKSFGV